MLVLSRRIGEKIVMTTPDGYKIEVTLLGEAVNHEGFRLGFDAPKGVVILREEVVPKKNEATTPHPQRRTARGGAAKSTV